MKTDYTPLLELLEMQIDIQLYNASELLKSANGFRERSAQFAKQADECITKAKAYQKHLQRLEKKAGKGTKTTFQFKQYDPEGCLGKMGVQG